ncbi:ABC transporter permease [Candidatus Margulisiibacteriota bacterium]
MKRILYLMQKEFRQIFREKANLVIIFIIPILQLFLLGFAITTDVKNIGTIIIDHDQSALSREIQDSLKAAKTFNLQKISTSYVSTIENIDAGKSKLALVIPPKFEKDVKAGRRPGLQALIDGVDGNTAGISLSYLNILANDFSVKWLKTNPKLITRNPKLSRPYKLLPRMLYNPDLASKYNIVPGILAMLLTMITLILTAINLVREKELGTLEQLVVTPIKKHEIILGKVLPFVILGFILLCVGILGAGLIFKVWIQGSLLLLFGISIIYMFTTLGLGILFSTIAKNQMQAMFYAWFSTVLTVLLAGLFIPIQNMPDWVQAITLLNPARYFITVVRGIFLKQAGFFDLLPQITVIASFGIIIFSLAITRFQKRIK